MTFCGVTGRRCASTETPLNSFSTAGSAFARRIFFGSARAGASKATVTTIMARSRNDNIASLKQKEQWTKQSDITHMISTLISAADVLYLRLSVNHREARTSD